MRYLTIAAAALLVWLLQAASASAAVNCIYHPEGIPKYASVNLTAAGDSVVLERDTFDDQLLVNGNVCIGGGELADNENTDTIFINDSSGGAANVRIKDPRAFSPGDTPEGQLTDSEIEFELNLGGGNDALVIDGSGDADNYTLGTAGLNTAVPALDFDVDVSFGGVNDATVYGHNGADTITAQGGLGTGEPLTLPVVFNGDSHDDQLEGGDAGDDLYGGEGNDTLEGGPWTDYLDGSQGTDTVSYRHATGGVTVALDPAEPTQQTGPTGADHLVSIQRLVGSTHDDVLANKVQSGAVDGANGNDRITGSASGETLAGGNGSDVIDPGAEATVYDLVTGGAGQDTVSYASAPKSVAVDLGLGDGNPRDGVGTGDEIGTIESIEGSAFSDRLVGNLQANTIAGRAGSDEIEAGDGADTVQVRDGEPDTVNCGSALDTAFADRRDQDALTDCETAEFLPDLPTDPRPQPQPETPPMTPEVPPEQPRTTPDTTLSFSLSAQRAQRLLRTRAILATVACAGEPCNIRAGGALGRIKLKSVTRSLTGDTRTRVKVPLSRRAISRIRSQLARRKTPRLTLNVTAADAAGNQVVRRSSIRVK